MSFFNALEINGLAKLIKRLANQHPTASTIAFHRKDLELMDKTLGTARKLAMPVEDLVRHLNFALADESFCNRVLGIYTVCPYEMDVLLLIKADLCVSSTTEFVPENKRVQRPAFYSGTSYAQNCDES
jgi:hypothetical protein